MEKGYYKDPKTGKTTKGSFEDAWKSFINKIKDEEGNGDSEARNVIKDKIKETLVQKLEEKLCPKGQAYIKKRKAAGEKSSAYLSGRAVKVCKGQMKG
jgi:hypothetical protein